MKFTETNIAGVLIVESDVFEDERGWFAATWVPEALQARGLDPRVAQSSLAWNRERGTIRGLHYQSAPFEEVKLVRPVRGSVFDVAVDVRPDSPTFLQWVGVELAWTSHRMLYVPHGCAHGYQTLTDDVLVSYVSSAPYSVTHQQGLRWDDPAVGVRWPLGPPTRLSPRDAAYPDFQQASRR
jgi:dTDP-4-dehydrorhamnose 3,5-epimerase